MVPLGNGLGDFGIFGENVVKTVGGYQKVPFFKNFLVRSNPWYDWVCKGSVPKYQIISIVANESCTQIYITIRKKEKKWYGCNKRRNKRKGEHDGFL
jgi:hypothetical protein